MESSVHTEASETASVHTEASKAAQNFDAEFDDKMDTKIHRFPPGLGEIIKREYLSMVEPTFVAIGPYHHEKEKLKEMETVKKAAARFLWRSSKKLSKAVQKAADAHYESSENPEQDDADATNVINAVHKARKMYFADEKGMMKVDVKFGDMMIFDACFLLQYMNAYFLSYGKDDGKQHMNESMRRFLFCNRDRINNDIMLLENQLPWPVIQVLMDLGSDLNLKLAVEYFIAAMGSSFKISVSSDLQPYVWERDGKNNPPPPHLLALLRRYKTEEPPVPPPPPSNPSCNHCLWWCGTVSPPPPSNPLCNHTPPSTTSTNQTGNSPSPIELKVEAKPAVLVSAISPMDLEEIGIKLEASETGTFSDMGLKEGRLLLSSLTLAPLSLSNTRASWLVNMAAFELCTASRFGDPREMTAVCSYLALLAFFMVGSEDVRKLRYLGLLNGPDSDNNMLTFFETLRKHLPDYGTPFAEVMAGIQKYKKQRFLMTTLYRWFYNQWATVAKWFSIIIAVVSAIAALISLYQALLSLIHK